MRCEHCNIEINTNAYPHTVDRCNRELLKRIVSALQEMKQLQVNSS